MRWHNPARIIHEFPGAVAERRRFHAEATEFKHREHGDVSANFSVHSVIPWWDDSNRNRLRELCVKRFGSCSSHSHFMKKPG